MLTSRYTLAVCSRITPITKTPTSLPQSEPWHPFNSRYLGCRARLCWHIWIFYLRTLEYYTYILGPLRPIVGIRLTPDLKLYENSDLNQLVKQLPTLGLLWTNFAMSLVLWSIKLVQMINNAPKQGGKPEKGDPTKGAHASLTKCIFISFRDILLSKVQIVTSR